MPLSHQAEAILLLTARLGRTVSDAPGPLTPTEWGRLASWLKAQGAEPSLLLTPDWEALFGDWSDRSISLDRIGYLLGRAGALALSLERWERAGVWVVARSDSDYPRRLKARLKDAAPPSLFGCGNRQLLNQGGIAILGSRNACPEDLEVASNLGAQAARQGVLVLSGVARGIDMAAAVGALSNEGTVIGVLSGDLMRTSTSPQYRSAIAAGDLCLISPFHPEAAFNVGNAMARNKYIYCLSDGAVVVAADNGKGGTWTGAVENLAHRWVPMWIQTRDKPQVGEALLLERGALPLPSGPPHIRELIGSATQSPGHQSVESSPTESTEHADPVEVELSYEQFLRHVQRLSPAGPTTARALAESMCIKQSAVAQFLKTAVSEGHIAKLKKPVRYVWSPDSHQATPLFPDL